MQIELENETTAQEKMGSKEKTKGKCWNQRIDICLLLHTGWCRCCREWQIQSVKSSSQSRTLRAVSEWPADSSVCSSQVSSSFLVRLSSAGWGRYYSPWKSVLSDIAVLHGCRLEWQKHNCICKASRSFPKGGKGREKEKNDELFSSRPFFKWISTKFLE